MRDFESEDFDVLQQRMDAILPNGRGVWVPIDHSVGDYPQAGLENIQELVDVLTTYESADAIVAHRGPVSYLQAAPHWEGGWVLHLSFSTRHGGQRASHKLIAEDALAQVSAAESRGATAVSVQVNIGDDSEPEMLAGLAAVADACQLLDMPLLGMMYPRGPNLNPVAGDTTGGVSHAARIGWELGCDIVKVPWTGDAESFARVTSAVPIPVLVSGGPKTDDFEGLLEMVEQALSVGASGVCIGRQIFADSEPLERVREIRRLVHPPRKKSGPELWSTDFDESEDYSDLVAKFRHRLDNLE